MNQRSAESRISIAFSICVALGATASITSGIAWGHWNETLDQCVNQNCSCILYGRHTEKYFLGGPAGPCIWVTFGPLVYVLFCIAFACFHGFRVLFGTQTGTTRTIATKNNQGEDIVMQAIIDPDNTKPLPRCYWITGSVLTAIFTVYSLAHFAVYLDGYLSTCAQYRQTLVRELNVHGTILPVIHERLACNAIYDFMDYIQPDTALSHRDGFINTAADLIIGIVSSCFAWVLFLYAMVVYILFARRKD